MTEPRGLRVGYKASAEQFAPGELAAYAVRAEELGLDSVTVSDHFQPWRLEGGHAPSSLAWMPWVLARTERVVVGTSVMTPTFRYNPAVVAQTFATMACLAPGRVVLGVGTGEALNEVAVGSVAEGEWPEFKERFGRLREAVRLMRRLWTEDRVTFEGEYYRTEDAAVYDRPDRPFRCTSPPGGRWSPGTPAASPTASSARRARGASSTPTSSSRPSTRGSTRPGAATTRSTG